MSLSDKIYKCFVCGLVEHDSLYAKDVKLAVKELKEDVTKWIYRYIKSKGDIHISELDLVFEKHLGDKLI